MIKDFITSHTPTNLLIGLSLFFSTICFGQWREIYKGNDENNAINGVSFITPSTGFLAFTKFIGFTTDSGRTYTPRYVRYDNIDFNSFSGVNLTFTFEATGVHAFSADSLLIFGDFGWEPAILFSANQGQTWKLVYHKALNPSAPALWNAITDLKFQGNIGLAVHHEAILKSTNRGQTWSVVLNASNATLQKLSFLSSGRAFAVGGNKMYKTNDAGTTWSNLALPSSSFSDNYNNVFFLNDLTGYISQKGPGRIYKTVTGGAFWNKMNDEAMQGMNGTDMYFTNDSTGFVTSEGLYEVYKTSDNGKTWEWCKRNSDYQYLYYGMNRLFFYNNQIGWACGSKEYLMINSSGSFPTFPKASFKTDTNGVASTNIVKLLNYSKPSYQYQWYKDGTLIGTSYNINYTHDRYKARDTLKLVVTNGNDTDTSVIYQDFRVPILPAITSFSPTEGSTGAVIVIKGKNFNSINNMQFGGVPASSFIVLSDTTIRAIVGSGASGNVSLSTTSGSVAIAGFTFVPPPTAPPPFISSFSPTSGPIGTTVVISGQNFDANKSNNIVYFGAVKGTILSSSNTSITCIVPFGASFSPISILNGTTHLSGKSFKPFAVTFADTSNFTQSSFTKTHSISLSIYDHTREVGAADLDGDGKPDLIATIHNYKDSIIVFRNTSSQGNFSFSAQQTLTEINQAGSGKFVIEDFDGDGKPDIVSTTNTSKLVTLKNTSSEGNISFIRQLDVYCPYDSWSIRSGDLDNDGREDVVLGTPYKVSVLKNISYPGTISFGLSSDYNTEASPTGVAIGDLNGDGWKDIVSLNDLDQGISISVLKNQSTTGIISFSTKQDFPVPGWGVAVSTINLIDFDGDNKLDIVVANGRDFSILKNTSTASVISFAPINNYTSYEIFESLSFEFLNGDSKPDVILGAGGLVLQRNLSEPGSIEYEPQVKIPEPLRVWSSTSADFNLDGRVDIATSSTNNVFSFFKNTMGAIVSFTICKNGHTSIEADLTGNSYQWQIDTGAGFADLSNNSNYSGAQTKQLYFSLIPLSFDRYKYRCIIDGRTSSIYQMKVNPGLQASVTISASDTIICTGNTVNFTAIGANGGDYPSYQWQINGRNVGANSPSFNTTSLKDNDKVRVILYSSNYCSGYSQDTSNVINVHVKGGTPFVSINTSNNTICFGASANFIADTSNVGPNPVYQWQLNNTNVGTNSATFNSNQLRNGDKIQLTLSNITTPCAAGLSIISNIITMTVNSVTPSVAISPKDTSVCSGSSITFTAVATNGGASPVYQWQANGSNVGVNSNTYTASALTDGSQVNVILTSSAGCSFPQKDTSNIVTIKVLPYLPPSVTITSSTSSICQGNPVTFTATASNTGANPTYQWSVNGVKVGSNNNSYTTNSLNDNDQVMVTVTSTSGCSNGASNSSNTININVNGKQKVGGKVLAPNAICTGSPVTISFRATQIPIGSEVKLWENINGNYIAKGTQSYNGSDLSFTVIASASSISTKFFFSIMPPPSTCFEAGNSDTVNIQIDQSIIPIIISKNRILSIINSDANSSYKWQSLKATLWQDVIPAASGLSYNVTDSGSYRVKADKGACTHFSNVIVMTSDSLVVKDVNIIYAYPNPTNGILVIDSLNLSDNWETLDIINSISGQKVASFNITGKTSITLHLEYLAPGIYIASFVRKDGSRYSMKFIKV